MVHLIPVPGVDQATALVEDAFNKIMADDDDHGIPSSIQLWWEEATGPLNAEHFQSMTRAVFRKVLLWVPVAAILLILPLMMLLAKAAHEYQWIAPKGQKTVHKVETGQSDLDNLLRDPVRR